MDDILTKTQPWQEEDADVVADATKIDTTGDECLDADVESVMFGKVMEWYDAGLVTDATLAAAVACAEVRVMGRAVEWFAGDYDFPARFQKAFVYISWLDEKAYACAGNMAMIDYIDSDDEDCWSCPECLDTKAFKAAERAAEWMADMAEFFAPGDKDGDTD